MIILTKSTMQFPYHMKFLIEYIHLKMHLAVIYYSIKICFNHSNSLLTLKLHIVCSFEGRPLNLINSNIFSLLCYPYFLFRFLAFWIYVHRLNFCLKLKCKIQLWMAHFQHASNAKCYHVKTNGFTSNP